MGKIWIEVCLISARGLKHSSLFWKLQWFAVGWIDLNNKYCTKVDKSKNSNPVWKTKFSTCIDSSESNIQDLTLNVEVYSREPVFLRERLHGTTSVGLKEFLDKYAKDGDGDGDGDGDFKSRNDQVGSFQLRKKNSSKPRGFVDISVRISEEMGGKSSFPDNEEGIQLKEHNICDNFTPTDHAHHPSGPPLVRTRQREARPTPFPITSNYPRPSSLGGPTNHSPRTPSPPQIPNFIPRTDNLPPTYMNMPRAKGAGLGMGMGAGALAAGAMIFGDDFMSGFDDTDNTIVIQR